LIQPPLLTTWAVLTEVFWLIRGDSMAINTLFTMLEGGLVEIDPLAGDAVIWLRAFMSKYQDIGVQVADASICYLAEKHEIDTVFTLDRRDFSIYRIKGNQALKIIP
jgi:predicted nucleic acid-binding protein